MHLYPFFVTPSSPINALTSNLFRVRLGIKRIVTPHSIYLSHSLACPLCVPLRQFVYSHTCMSVDPVGKARSKSDYGLFSISFLISLDWDNKEETRKRSVYRLRAFLKPHSILSFDKWNASNVVLVYHYFTMYVSILMHSRRSTSFVLQWQIYALFLNSQNFFEEILQISLDERN